IGLRAPRTADGRGSLRAAQGDPELGVRAHTRAWRCRRRASASHQDRQVRSLRCTCRSRVSREKRPTHVIRFPSPATIGPGLNHEEPTGGKGVSRMARTKRQYGSGCLLKRRRGWVIRWREIEIAPDGSKKKALRYERLGEMSRKEAAERLAQKL